MTNLEKYQEVRALMMDYARLADKLLPDVKGKPDESEVVEAIFGPIEARAGELDFLDATTKKEGVK